VSGVQQGGSINACVLLCVRDRCLSNIRVLLCFVAIVELVDRSDGRYGDAKARCVNVVFVRRRVYSMQDRARRQYQCYARRNSVSFSESIPHKSEA
jgi:hypothetical protein